MRNWYRLMGCKIGKGSEISTNLAGRYDLVEIGANNFIGDEASLGDEEVRRGWMTLKRIRTGNRVFIGNDAIVAQGAELADDTLVGVKSKLPDALRRSPIDLVRKSGNPVSDAAASPGQGRPDLSSAQALSHHARRLRDGSHGPADERSSSSAATSRRT